jgi:cobalt-zinc-cadmium efflux system membrane fusion protein
MWRLLRVVGLIGLWACTPKSGAQEIERSPYTVDGDELLQVRADLLPHLHTSPARAAAVAAELEGFGRVSFAPGASYAITIPFSGLVERVDVRAGERVAAGATLALIRSSELARARADLRRSVAMATAERDALDRAERLVAEGAASTREVVEAQARLGSLEAEIAGIREALKAAKTNASGTDLFVLRASRPGSVLARNIEPGERVQPGVEEPAFVVGDSKDLVLTADFPERDAPLLREGAPCSFTVPALGQAKLPGKVVAVIKGIDHVSRTAKVVCTPERAAEELSVEMVARVVVSVAAEGVLTVPRDALLLRRDEQVVLVRRSPDLLERRRIATGLVVGSDVQVLAGLDQGEEVVIEGAVLLDGELDRLL